jgi:ecotin
VLGPGSGMAERQETALQRVKWETDAYVWQVVGESPAEQIGDGKSLLDGFWSISGEGKMKPLVSTLLLFVLAIPAAQAADNMQAFPPAEAGMVRYVLELPQQDDESAFKVELAVGKTVQTDAQNRYFFGGEILEETIEGWGFPRFVVNALGPMAGTLMAVDPAAPRVARFITLGGEPFLIRYNSRLPVVVYVPEGVEVRYRIWTAGQELRSMDKG